MKTKNFLIVIAASSVLGAIAVSLLLPRTFQKSEAPREFVQPDLLSRLPAQPANLILLTDTSDTEDTISLSLDVADSQAFASAATVYTVSLRFDPSAIRLLGVASGDIWQDSNILEEKIDNEAGELTFTVGKGFNEGSVEFGENNLLMMEFAKVQGSDSAQTTIVLGEASSYAADGIGGRIYSNALTLKLN